MSRKLKQLGTMNMFEASTAEQSESKQAAETSSSEVKIDLTACPRCGSRSLKTVRSFEHDGHTNYCAGGCLSEDRTDAFYFTPVVVEKAVETFAEQAAREEAKKIVAEEKPPLDFKPIFEEVETEIVGEGEQKSLIDVGEKWEEAWRGMPEFVQENLKPYKTVYVHFEKRKDMEAFAKLVAQRITLDTQSIWYPENEGNDFSKMRYVDKATAKKNLAS